MPENASAENTRAQRKVPVGVGSVFPDFSARGIAEECLARLMEVARQPGAGWNPQPCRWIVVRSEAAKRRVEAASYIQMPLSSAPAVLICVADTLAWKSAPQRLQEMVASGTMTEEQGRETLRRVQEYYSASPENAQRTALANGWLAVQQVLLGAASCDLSAYWVTEFDPAKIKTHFHIPDHFAVVALLTVGHINEPNIPPSTEPAPRAPVYLEKFGKPFSL